MEIAYVSTFASKFHRNRRLPSRLILFNSPRQSRYFTMPWLNWNHGGKMGSTRSGRGLIRFQTADSLLIIGPDK